jgi:large subunit ribosomal protein L17
MRHRKAGIKLNRTTSHRNAMFRNMVTSLFKHERIRTTDTKAKELCRWADRMITLAKRGDLHARRQALAVIREKAVVHKLFDEVAARFDGVSGGYTRVVKVGRRPGDAAPISIIELVTPATAKKKKTKKKKSRSGAAPKQAAPKGAATGKAKPKAAAKKATRPKADTPEKQKASKTATDKAETAADRDASPADVAPETDPSDETKAD